MRRVILFFGILGLLSCIIFYIIFSGKNEHASTIILGGDPLLVVSRLPGTRFATVVSIPSTLLFDGVRGYGRYSLEALLKLGIIDQVGAQLVRETLSESLAVPIEGFIGLNSPKKASKESKENVSRIVSVFCGFRCIVRFIRGSEFLTDLSFVQYARATLFFGRLSESDIQFIDIIERNSISEVEESDGVSVSVFDTKKYDSYVPNIFENLSLRKEAIRVRVINATSMTGLADRFSRKLSRVGALPVAVESAQDRELKQCELSGVKTNRSLLSLTASYLKEIYDCTVNQKELSDGRVDLTVRIGTMYERLYLPLQVVHRQTPRP
jgi:hypothetical protein